MSVRNGIILNNACWVSQSHGVSANGRAGLFLDRDGVIILDTGYPRKAESVVLFEGVSELISNAVKLSMPVCIVTNQSGVGRGILNWDDFQIVQNRMMDLLQCENGHQNGGVSIVLACPFNPEKEAVNGQDSHDWRKPNPGMILEASRLLDISLKNSILVGDKITDIQAAENSGISRKYLLASDQADTSNSDICGAYKKIYNFSEIDLYSDK